MPQIRRSGADLVRAPRLRFNMRLRSVMPVTVPEVIELGVADGIGLRRARPFYAEALVQCVAQSRAHLQPWMPWASAAESFDIDWQRTRLTKLEAAWEAGEEFQYVVVDRYDTRVLGGCGLMTRRGAGTLEIGYFIHVDFGGRGYARAAAKALTDVACAIETVQRVYICCDAANERSAAIPRALGYDLEATEAREQQAPAETGQGMVWVLVR